jgi:hypothetical protein
MIGTTTLIANAIPLLQGLLQVWDGPELAIESSRPGAKQVARGVGMESALEVLDLAFGQSGPIPPRRWSIRAVLSFWR